MKKNLLITLSILVLGACVQAEDRDDGTENYAGASELETFCDRLPRAAYAAYEKHTASNDWFEVYEVEPDIFAIYEPFQWQEVISYLVVGTERALLFDTGNGIGDIKSVVDQLTDKSVLIINSHSHFDHIGGNHQFSQVASVSTPFSVLRSKGLQSDDLTLEVSDEALCKPLPPGVTRENHRIHPYTISQQLNDGESIDIGGRSLEIVSIPGHTDDAIALLDRQAGFLWSGDSFYEGPIWLFAPGTNLKAYKKSTARLAALAPDLKAVFPAHNTPKSNPKLLMELHKNFAAVIAGDLEPDTVFDGRAEFKFDHFSLLVREDFRDKSP